MIECGSCGTDADVLDRSGAWDSEEELVVLCAECAPGEITAVIERDLLERALPTRSEHARAA